MSSTDVTPEILDSKKELDQIREFLGLKPHEKTIIQKIFELKEELVRLREADESGKDYFEKGYREGYNAGYDSGYDSGYAICRESQDYENDEERIQ